MKLVADEHGAFHAQPPVDCFVVEEFSIEAVCYAESIDFVLLCIVEDKRLPDIELLGARLFIWLNS